MAIKDKKNQVKDNEMLGRLAPSKGKIIAACVLVAIMALMWVRVFFKSDAKEADAAILQQAAVQSQDVQSKTPQIRLEYISLPVVQGRNDVLTADIFTPQKWTAFSWPGWGEVKNPTGDKSADNYEKTVREITDNLTVEAIITNSSGRAIQAYIANNVVSVGSKLRIKHDNVPFEFTVTQIEENKVVLGWENLFITLNIIKPDTAD